MKQIEIIKKKIALRKQRKTIMGKMSIQNGKIVIDSDVIVKGNITGR